ncbi:MAG: hypothetical protein Q7S92_03095 [Candidatus Diapherotrites archaeon]|nr:hypothetical protein [Candidatus Diapherotrites archaeon]
MRFSIIVFFVFLFPVFVLAQDSSFSEFNAEYTIHENEVQVGYALVYENLTDLNLVLPLDSKNVQVTIPGMASVSFDVVNFQKEKILKIPSLPNSGTLTIAYSTKELLQYSNRSFFLSELRASLPAQILNVQIKLTEGQALLNPISSSDQPVFPLPDSITSDGQNILLQWHRFNLKKNESIVFLVFLKSKNDSISFLLFIIFSLVIIAGVVGYFFKHKKPKFKLPSFLSQPNLSVQNTDLEFESHLLEKEKAILQALKNAPNFTVKQKQLQAELNFSKAKLSRTLKDLQVRGLIEVVPYGNTNLVKLLEQVKK